jgi:ribosomal-protein-alanine N-acetyltransferase
MLELKETCELCAKLLTKKSTEAYICSYECTYCSSCATEQLKLVCPNCNGELLKRPSRKGSVEIWMQQVKYLETQRLKLFLFDQQSYDDIFALASKQEIMQIFGHQNDEEYELECARFKGGFSTYNLTIQFFQLMEKETNVVIGWAGYHSWAKQHHRAEIFYSLKKDEYKRKGYMSEALQPILDYGKTEMDLHRIEAFVATDNIASNRLMEKFGFQKEATIKHRYQFGDDVDTDHMYCLFPNAAFQ